MNPILCVIDLTESSAPVLNVAAKIANALKTHLTVLFPYRLIEERHVEDAIGLKAKILEEASEKFNGIKNAIKEMKGLSYEFQPEIGFSSDRIASHIKRNPPGMVIVSQHQANITNEPDRETLKNLITNSILPFMIVPDETQN